jgi:hypothetical protein
LQYRGKGFEVGASLVESEREELASGLRDLLDFRLPSSVPLDR